ncbi:pseudouridine synthase [Gordonibacter sp. Marseille-P4307]|uniref:pseudouridine synthase n=1 Tax=Gordonibacter sp. Marseille-P4307 TaxID=2161815 RepID=UPI000F52BBD8|nr:pseudouridine synthase [Gordonibacter sp. Marseille-P4307]
MTEPDNRTVPLRLQKFLARAGVASRRGSENLMTAGRVTVNGVVVTELGSKVDPRIDQVRVDGVPVALSAGPITVMLHKPAGVITTMKDARGRACVADLVPADRYPGLFPIGRLDADTTGLLLFSTDGELGNGLLHPRHHVPKRYIALVEGSLSKGDLEALRNGVELDDGLTRPARVDVLPDPRSAIERFDLMLPSKLAKSARMRREWKAKERAFDFSAVRLEIREGRYHQVKRMLEAVSHPVVALHRDAFGPIELGDLPRGLWRVLDEDEVSALNEARCD